jgi:lipopolysaccharide/colanic/teichoic acid biosynthesis glycosyltransferase
VLMRRCIGDGLTAGDRVIRYRSAGGAVRGLRLGGGARLRSGTTVKIHAGCYLAQFIEIEEDAFLVPGVALTNDLSPGRPDSAEAMSGPTICAQAQVGANVTILPFVTVGQGALVCAGSVVTRDIPPGTVRPSAPSAAAAGRRGGSRADALAMRLFDITVAVLGLIIAGPLVGLAALPVRATSRGPALFRQTRVGHLGRPFEMLKLRTMYVHCDDMAHRDFVTRVLRGEDPSRCGPVGLFKLEQDPCVTPIGGILRRASLDELPQLFNVLRGQMSLVGPRPALAWEVALYQLHHQQRFQVKPGITGLWQVRGRSRLTMNEALELDVEYVRCRSLTLDLRILAMTVPAVLRGGNAR